MMGKAKNLASVIVALAILYARYEIAMEAFQGERIERQNVWPTVASVVCANYKEAYAHPGYKRGD